MKYLVVLLLATYSFFGSAQVFWTEDFGTGCSQNNPANGTATANGNWTVTDIGAPDPAASNAFFISATEAGMGSGNCGDGCLGTGGNDRTLHIGNEAGTPASAFFCPAGDCGAAYDAAVEASIRAESPVINCTGQTTITLEYEYIHQGTAGTDFGSVWYFDGATWAVIQAAIPQVLCCDILGGPDGVCDGLFYAQGKWNTATVALPASADNNPNVRIAFQWENNNDNVGTDPSLAVDNVTLSSTTTSTPPTASFLNPGALCVGDCINLDASGSTQGSNGPITTYSWVVTPGAGAPAIPNGVNPTNICWNTAGTYDITLTVDDGTNTDDTTIQVVVSNCAQPVASFLDPGALCVGDCINLDASGSTQGSNGPLTSYTWVVAPAAGAPAIPNGVNPTNICWNTAGTYDITLTVSDGTDTDDTTIQVVVSNCALPVASFIDPGTLCVGDCINLDASGSTQGANGPLTSYTWVVAPAAGAPAIPNGVNPTNICWNTAGTYDITLTVGDGTDTDDTTIQVVVNTCNVPTASFVDPGPLCVGDCINLDASNSTQGSNGPLTSYTWVVAPAAGAPTIPNGVNPTNICWNTAGTYDITLTVGDGTDTDDTTIQVVVTACTQPVASFVAPGALCTGDCIGLDASGSTQGSNGPLTSYTWTVAPAAGAPTIPNGVNPTNICWNTAGTYDVTLTVSDGTDTDDTTIQVVVTACNVPVANFSFPATICAGQCIDFMDLSTGTPTMWEWTFNGATPSMSSDQNPTQICFPAAGTFDVTLIASNSSGSDTLTTAVTVSALPVVNAGPDVTITIGESTTLNPAGPPGNYVWSPIIGLSCDVCLNPSANPLITTEYTVTVTDANGCSGSDNVIVYVNVVEGIGVPNAFSPNGDGNNDVLFVKGNGIERMTFSVYNRYGQKVFESTDQTIGWDGTHNGKEVNTGVFVYVVEYQFFGSDIQKITGNVTLTK